MNREDKAKLLDMILGRINGMSVGYSRDIYFMVARDFRDAQQSISSSKFIGLSFAYFSFLIEELGGQGLISLSPVNGPNLHFEDEVPDLQEYTVHVTTRGVSFLGIEGGFKSRYEAEIRQERKEKRKELWLIVNSIAVVITALLPLLYDIWKDVDDKRDVIKHEMTSADLEKLKIVLDKLYLDSTKSQIPSLSISTGKK
ncbi:hypothetical protein [Dyadobacter sp. CY343]|uniref:hypothetical protein n=1 Tax=Dyadobacter sp. CY343 TaxID=2907299 RepID=UPI001F3DAA68|nr:hypothetical protein [Dyadobacter sp. CY343]MCE7061938.1 hypothetical protein [Dyadobacter sp. CY343]